MPEHRIANATTKQRAEPAVHLPANLVGRSVLIYGEPPAELVSAIRARGGNVTVGGLAPHRFRELFSGHSGVECEPSDVERNDISRAYDFILSIKSLVCFRNPLAVLERMVMATRDSLQLVHSRPSSRANWSTDPSVVAAPLLDRLPGMFLVPARRKRGMDQAFNISPSLIEAFLKSMRQDISSIECLPGGAAGETMLLVRKRRIGRLLVLAGVNAVGKSTFLDRLRSGQLPEIAAALDMDMAKPWEFTTYAHLLGNRDDCNHDAMVVQYNITAPEVHGPVHGHHHGVLDLILCAEDASIATFWLDPETQHARYHQDRVPGAAFSSGLHARRKLAKSLGVHGNGHSEKSVGGNPFYVRSAYARRKAARLLKLYGDTGNFVRMYRDWFDFAEAHCQRVQVIHQEPDYRIGTVDEWRSMIAARP